MLRILVKILDIAVLVNENVMKVTYYRYYTVLFCCNVFKIRDLIFGLKKSAFLGVNNYMFSMHVHISC